MIIDKQPKTYLITLFNNDHSKNLANDCIQSGNQHNWLIEQFQATDGNLITKDVWKDLLIKLPNDTKFLKRLGAQGCFLSHYCLWSLCALSNEPIIVLEHDAIINYQWEAIEINHPLVKLYLPKKFLMHDVAGTWEVGSSAYVITPDGAKTILQWVSNNYALHVDVLIGSNIINWTHLNKELTTLNKNNISTIFIKKKL